MFELKINSKKKKNNNSFPIYFSCIRTAIILLKISCAILKSDIIENNKEKGNKRKKKEVGEKIYCIIIAKMIQI